jgi:TonB-dependent starch-binding outer membrane protein SusC
MIKKCNWDISPLGNSFIKLLLIMKLATLLLIVGSLQVSASLYSQDSKINLNIKNGTIQDVFNEIEKQSDFNIFFKTDEINVKTQVNISASDIMVKDALNEVLESSNLSYRVLDKIIIITPVELLTKQQQKISGTVTDATTGEPIIGANIILEGTTIGIITDGNGRYSIDATIKDAVIIVSFIGYNTERLTVNGMSVVDIKLIPNITKLDEIVVVGYGTQRKLEVTSAVASVKADDFIKGSVKDAAQLIQGKVAGLTIGTPSGDPDAQSQILLRGTATLATSTQPLILIDGIPGSLNTVPSEEIESIDVLKDGSSAAIYGTRGTNGVILITTKRASGNIEPTIEYNSYISTQSFVNLPNMLSAEEYRARLAQGTNFQDFGSNIDWVKEISRKNPLSHNHNLTFSGGNSKTNYLATLGYRQQEGIFITSESRTFNSRFDLNHNMFNDKLKINLNYINVNNNSGIPFDGSIYKQATRYNPTAPIKNPDGTWFENSLLTENVNPVAWLKEQYGSNQSQSTRVSGSVTWLPVTDLKFKMLVSNSQGNSMSSIGRTKNHYVSTQDGNNGTAEKSSSQSTDQLMELTALYSKTYNSHNFSALVGYSYQHSINENERMYNYDFPAGNFSYIDNIGLGSALTQGKGNQSSFKEASNLIGFFGRITYNYKEKYLVMANLRHEASSRFVGTKEPWGTFPSVSVGWRISEEDFMKKMGFVDNLKLRAGYGVTGTAPDKLFLGVSRLGYDTRYLIDGQWVFGLSPINNPNPYLKWEVKKELNIGMDFSIFNGKISGSIDLYNRRTDGLLYDYAVPSPPNLYNITTANVGIMDNRGIEVLLNFTPVQTKEFSWNSSITFSTNRNKLVSLDNDLYKVTNPWFNAGLTPTPILLYSHRVEVGNEIGNFWGFKVIDISDDGYWIYEDKDGKPAKTVTESDKKKIGNGLPKFYTGWNNSFRYGNFDLDITMRGAFGFQIINSQRMLFEVPGFSGYNQLSSAYDKVFGKVVLNKNVYPDYNSYYVENGDYWKIDNVTLGYNFIVSGTRHIKSARVYVSTLNTLTITGYKGMDPEVNELGLTPGYDNRDKYPSTRIYTVGLRISFK